MENYRENYVFSRTSERENLLRNRKSPLFTIISELSTQIRDIRKSRSLSIFRDENRTLNSLACYKEVISLYILGQVSRVGYRKPFCLLNKRNMLKDVASDYRNGKKVGCMYEYRL